MSGFHFGPAAATWRTQAIGQIDAAAGGNVSRLCGTGGDDSLGTMAISPMPPIASGVGLPWDVPVEDPIAALAEARRSLGDTFVVDSGEDRYLFTFSPTGVKSFYALPEDRASKGVADWRMLRRKLPDQIFVGRRTLPHQLFGRDDVADYLTNVEWALDATVAELSEGSEAEVFALTRRLGHRVGLASWGGPGSAFGDRFNRLSRAFDTLDGSDSFVHPDAMSAVAASEKSAEIDALAAVIDELGSSLNELGGHESDHPLFSRIADRWEGSPPSVQVEGVAMDAALIHIASMSNLFAALGWVLVDLLAHRDEMERVRGGDRGLAEMCALESTRLSQRSIMSRYVLEPVTLDTGHATHHVGPASPSRPCSPLPIRPQALGSIVGIPIDGIDGAWQTPRRSPRSSWSPCSDTGATHVPLSRTPCRP
jgi:hypothetical protein